MLVRADDLGVSRSAEGNIWERAEGRGPMVMTTAAHGHVAVGDQRAAQTQLDGLLDG